MTDNDWNDWLDFLIHGFDDRLMALGAKGNRVTSGRKGLTALCLLARDPGVTAADILPEALKNVRGQDARDGQQSVTSLLDAEQSDDIAMLGHRIGLVENSPDLERYLQDAYAFLKPDGQMLFTSLDMNAITNRRQNTRSAGRPGEIGLQFQYGNLIGPFYSPFHFDTKALRACVATTNWQCVILQQQSDDNYLAWIKG